MPEMTKSDFFPDRFVGLNNADLAWNISRSKRRPVFDSIQQSHRSMSLVKIS